MTTNNKDKTREKLMGSMRKSKADAGIGSDTVETKAPTTNPEPSDKEKSMAKPGRATSVPQSQPQKVKTDSYQSGRRIWPD